MSPYHDLALAVRMQQLAASLDQYATIDDMHVRALVDDVRRSAEYLAETVEPPMVPHRLYIGTYLGTYQDGMVEHEHIVLSGQSLADAETHWQRTLASLRHSMTTLSDYGIQEYTLT